MQNIPLSLNNIRETYGGREIEAKKRKNMIYESLYGDVDGPNFLKRNIANEVMEELQVNDKYTR